MLVFTRAVKLVVVLVAMAATLAISALIVGALWVNQLR